MWLLPLKPSSQATYRALLRKADVGNSRFRTYCESASFNTLLGNEGVTSAIFTRGPKVWPPSVERKIEMSIVNVPPSQFGSTTLNRSADTKRSPFFGFTIGFTPMYCWNEHPVSTSLANRSAYVTCHVAPPSVERA